jgi:2,4-dienoyl-CoA reductase (NADPH2)
MWHRTQVRPDQIEGLNAADAHAVRDSIRQIDTSIPIIVTGGFQMGRIICEAIERGDCDAVSIARPLIANNDLVRYFERGEEIPEPKRCTYCNKCLINALKNPLGCYELARYDGDYDAMVKEVMSVFHPRPFQ